jgi:hypothetical protein
MSSTSLVSNSYVDETSSKIRAKEVPWPVRSRPPRAIPELTACSVLK